jgi:predicted secreted hydrolase
MQRRALLHSLLALPAAGIAGEATSQAVSPTRRLAFPRDFGAHPDARTEWWYATGWLQPDGAADATPRHGFQVTFFRSRTGVDAAHPSRFAASQLVFAHAAVTDLAGRRQHHDQRIARSGFGIAQAAEADTAVQLRDWTLQRDAVGNDGSRYRTQVRSDSGNFGFALTMATTQAVLLQGAQGFSQKGPHPEQASHYYSQPQLAVAGTLTLAGNTQAVRGRAWLDHEWSDTLLDPQAVGWDWVGMNLADGSALTAFRLRRADGSTLYAGGSFRAAAGEARSFASDAVVFTPGRRWESGSSRAVYPVAWTVQTPAGRFAVEALLDDQELDSRGSTGAVYWEGLSALKDDQGRVVGHGYLEMTGYAAALRL